MEHLGYRNLLEQVAEKFHTTPAAIIALNRPDMVLRAGTVLRLPNVLPSSRDYGDVTAEAAKMLGDLNVRGELPEASSEEGSGGKECVRKGKSRGSPAD